MFQSERPTFLRYADDARLYFYKRKCQISALTEADQLSEHRFWRHIEPPLRI